MEDNNSTNMSVQNISKPQNEANEWGRPSKLFIKDLANNLGLDENAQGIFDTLVCEPDQLTAQQLRSQRALNHRRSDAQLLFEGQGFGSKRMKRKDSLEAIEGKIAQSKFEIRFNSQDILNKMKRDFGPSMINSGCGSCSPGKDYKMLVNDLWDGHYNNIIKNLVKKKEFQVGEVPLEEQENPLGGPPTNRSHKDAGPHNCQQPVKVAKKNGSMAFQGLMKKASAPGIS
jgi:hypothetical protein